MWQGLFQGGAAAAGAYDQYDRLKKLGSDQKAELKAIGEKAQADTQFTPFNVTNNVGKTSVDASGNVNAALNDQWQGYSDQLRNAGTQVAGAGQENQDYINGLLTDFRAQQTDPRQYTQIAANKTAAFDAANDFTSRANGDYGAMQQDLYNQARAVQSPEEERQRLALEERLLAQGRGGVQTAMYGGTPEQLAMEKAIGENRNAAWANAFGQSQDYQRQQGDLAGMFSGIGQKGAGLQQDLASANVDDISKLTQTGASSANQYADAAARYGTGALAPSAFSLDALGQGLEGSRLKSAADIAGANLAAETATAGVGNQVNMEKIANDMLSGMWNNIAGIAGGVGGNADDAGGLWNYIKGLF